jgi:hypothetical protein
MHQEFLKRARGRRFFRGALLELANELPTFFLSSVNVACDDWRLLEQELFSVVVVMRGAAVFDD